jgi:hypothetical protein
MIPKAIIAENLGRVRQSVADACLRANRRPESVRLVAVTKSVGLEEIRALLELGQTDLAENRPQQFEKRVEELAAALRAPPSAGSSLPPADRRLPIPHWHFVGHLQRNKVKLVVPTAELIHSVDSLRLTEEIGRRAAPPSPPGGEGPSIAAQPRSSGERGTTPGGGASPRSQGGQPGARILLEINVAGEDAKDGVPPAEAESVALAVAAVPGVVLCGLMTMAPRGDSPEAARPVFAKLRALFERLRSAHGNTPAFSEFKELSMGMSGDFIPAVEEGATLIRIGTALFE